MKNNRLLIGLAGIGLFAAATIMSCKKDLDKTDPNVVTTDNYFNTSAQILAATNAIYSTMHSGNLVGREWFFLHDLRSDDVASGGGQLEVARAQILNGAIDPPNAIMNSVWSTLYIMIHRANTVLDNAPNAKDNTALTNRNVGEAKFLRAWAYNELVTMWGAVPMYITTVKTPTDYQPRAKEADVYALIIKDLLAAAAVLPGKSGYASIDQGRITNAAANAMLGRVYMQTGDYTSAKAALLKIPTTGPDGYALTSRYLDNFEEETEFNPESIFEVIFFDKGDNNFNWGGIGDGASNPQATVRNQEYNGVAWRNLIPSDKLLNEYESTANGAAKTDPRFSFSVYQSGDLFNNNTETLTDGVQNGNSSILNGVTKKISWRKFQLMYKEDQSFHPGGNNQRMIRYAEVLLMLAECENELGNMGTATTGAIGYLNQVRARPSVAMPAYPTAKYLCTNKAQVTAALIHEKTAEMGDEEVRNIDIIRWRKKSYFTADPLSYFKAGRDELLPIPQQEIDNNPKLGTGGINAQNPGY